jgi:hypothetical protein
MNTIDFVTIATLGNAQDFGDATQTRGSTAAFSSPTRFVSGNGFTPSLTNTIDFVEIATTGNAKDFGDMTHAPNNASGCSNGHGGL